jgi:hypothetical protein
MFNPIPSPCGNVLTGMPFSPRVVAMIILTALALGASGSASAEPPEMAVISYTIAPGEVGSPVETVTVARRGTKRTITLTHTGYKAKLQSETQSLTPEEFDKVWAIVTRDKLLEFTPEQRAGKAFDYGYRAIRTEIREAPVGPPQVRESRWTRPIENQDRVSPLIVKLAGLARSHEKTVKLELFVP